MRSPSTSERSGESVVVTVMRRDMSSPCANSSTSRATSLTSTGCSTEPPFLSNARSRSMTAPARLSPDDVVERHSQPAVERLSIEQIARRLRIDEDCREWLAQFMGKGA